MHRLAPLYASLMLLTACPGTAGQETPNPPDVTTTVPDADAAPIADADAAPAADADAALSPDADATAPNADAALDSAPDASTLPDADGAPTLDADAQADPDDSGPADSSTLDVSVDMDAGPLAPLGTFANPIVISSLPFGDSRDTAMAPGPVFDAYECALETDEGGDGFVYRLDVTEVGVIEVAVNDVPADGVDVDVHLLESDDPGSCLIRDNIAFTYEVTPGPVYIVVDTWVNASGQALAGPYTLSVAFTSDTSGDAPYGSSGNPILVDGFPFSDSRDTELSPSSLFDSYSCAPTTDEGGPEFIYQLTIPASGQLTATIDDVSGDAVDVDLHLLSSLDPASCLARDNSSLTEQLTAPGVYYVVVDTWVNSSGVALTGPYTLDLSFQPDAPVAPGYGSLSDPIIIDTFPFYDVRDTHDGPSDVFDAYSCAPDTDESGKEFIYAVDVQQPGVLQASLVDTVGDGIDIDIHLLAAASADACVARGNRSLAAEVTPDTYYLVADTYVTSDGKPLAGPYELHVSFVPQPDLSSFCLVLYGDTRGGTSSDPQLAHQKVAAAIDARCANTTLVHTGDHVRAGYSDSDWATFVAIEKTIYDNEGTLTSVRGNHDGSWSNLKQRLAPLGVTLPAQSTFTKPLAPNLTLIGLDSEEDAAAQVAFLQQTFAANPGHRFVIAFHRPLYPSVGGHKGWGPGQEYWMPEFVAQGGGVLVATGHNHGMSREFVDGVMLLTAGGGGAPLYGCGKAYDDTRYCQSAYGYTVCDASLACLTYRVDPDSGAETLVDAFVVNAP